MADLNRVRNYLERDGRNGEALLVLHDWDTTACSRPQKDTHPRFWDVHLPPISCIVGNYADLRQDHEH